MANNFLGDANCKALWQLESGALTADSKGTNTLTNNGVGEDTTNYKEGSCSGLFVSSESDYLNIGDSDLNSGFPLKSGESNKTFSITFWLKLAQLDKSHYIVNKYASGKFSFHIMVDSTTNKVRLYISSDGSGSNNYEHASALSADTWYHIGVTYDSSDDSYRIRIWDDTAEEILGTDLTGTSTDIHIDDADFRLGYISSVTINGNLDEAVVFSDVLSVTEIDKIRAGTYGAVLSLSGTIAAQSAASGSIKSVKKVAGTCSVQSVASGSVKSKKQLSGSISVQSTVSANVLYKRSLSGTVDGKSAASGSILSLKKLAGTLAVQSSVTGSVGAKKTLSGSIDCQSSASGNLTIPGEFIMEIYPIVNPAVAGTQGLTKILFT